MSSQDADGKNLAKNGKEDNRPGIPDGSPPGKTKRNFLDLDQIMGLVDGNESNTDLEHHVGDVVRNETEIALRGVHEPQVDHRETEDLDGGADPAKSEQ